MARPHHPRAHRARVCALGALLVMLCAAAAVSSAAGATGSVTVSMQVPSATSITNSCTQEAAWSLGTILPGSGATTAVGGDVCRIGFSSSNDTASLRAVQADRTGAALATTAGHNAVTESIPFMDVDAWDTNNAVALEQPANRRIWRTSDGGTTWNPDAQSVPNPSEGVAMTGASSVVAVGSAGTVYLKADSSSGWALATTTPPASVSLMDVDAATSQDLYVVGSGAYVGKSTDGGANWSQVSVSAALGGATPDLLSVRAVSASVVWIGGSNGWLLRSGDGGATWSARQAAPGYAITGIDAIDGTTAWASSDGGGLGKVLRTTTGSTLPWTASTWSDVSPTPAAAWQDIVADSASSALLVGATPGVSQAMTTSTGGASWSAVGVSGFTDLLFAVDKVPGTTAVLAVGGSSGILRAPTLGGTFSVLRRDRAPVRALDTWHGRSIIAVGDDGYVSTWDGTTWTDRVLPSDGAADLLGVAAAGAARAWAVGTGGVVRTSSDGGTSWIAQASGTGVDLTDVAAASLERAWTVGDAGTVLGTTDGGASWVAQPSPTANRLEAVDVVGQQVAWAAGAGGTVIRTLDGGATWSLRAAAGSNRITSIAAVDSQTAFVGTRNASSQDSTIYRTTDGGTTWTALGIYGGIVAALDARHIMWAAGYAVGASSDGGATTRRITAAGQAAVGETYSPTALVMRDANSAMVSSFSARRVMWGNDGIEVADYSSATNRWDGAGTTNLFGGCVQATSGSTTIGAWPLDPSGTCTPVDADPWNPVPTTPVEIGRTSSAGATGQLDLVWGFRARADQAPGRYAATVAFEVIAPAT